MMAERDERRTAGESSESTPGADTPAPAGIRRHLFFGLALVLAFGSMYAGVLGLGRVVQYGLAIAAAVVVVVALSMTASNPQRPPS